MLTELNWLSSPLVVPKLVVSRPGRPCVHITHVDVHLRPRVSPF